MAAPDYSALIPNFGPVVTAVLFVFAAILAVIVVWFGANMILAAVRGEVFYAGRRYKREVFEAALSSVKRDIRRGVLVDKASRDAVARFEGTGGSRHRSSGRVPNMRV